MARQNRVNPMGELVASPAKGLLMGNKGCLHDDQGRITGRRWTTKSWVSCALEFGGWKQEIMKPGFYTQLFFLDEPTALAAGHRPCWTCRRQEFKSYMDAVGLANGAPVSKVAEVDTPLHLERTVPLLDRPVVDARELPDGAIVTWDEASCFWLKWEGAFLRWSFQGHERGLVDATRPAILVTPATTVSALGKGYPVRPHPTAYTA